MRIQIAGLPPDPQIFDQESAASRYVGGNDVFPRNLRIRATLERGPDVLKVLLEVEAEASFVCDRCNDCFTRKHLCASTIYYAFDDGKDLAADPEQTLLPKNAQEIDLSQDIRDLLILELPSKVLCAEDCKGLCPNCGANLNREKCSCQEKPSDPRWEALKKLQDKSTE